jgi:hypothetical protein
MTKKLEDYFKEFEDKVVGIVEMIDGVEVMSYSARPIIFRNFSLIRRFIKAQQNLENQRDLWLTTIDLLNDSKAFDDKVKEEIREELLVDCFAELEKLNNIILQLHTQKTTTVEGNSEKANKPDAKFNWQGTQAQLVYLIEQLYKKGFLSPILQPDKHKLTAQHFTVKGESLNPKTLAQIRQNSLNTKKGKPKDVEKIEQIVSATKKQNP